MPKGPRTESGILAPPPHLSVPNWTPKCVLIRTCGVGRPRRVSPRTPARPT